MESKRGTKKRFLEFARMVKQNPHRHLYIRNRINQLKHDNVDINMPLTQGNTLLHLAIKLNSIKLLNIFIKAGLILDLANEMGETPLHMAVNNHKIKMIQALVEAGCDINMGGELEQTPLHMAVLAGNTEVVKYLIANGADQELMDEKNNFPIDYAIDENDLEMIDILLNKQIVNEERMIKIRKIKNRKGEPHGI